MKQTQKHSCEGRENQPIKLDVIIPVYNEAAVLAILVERLNDIFSIDHCQQNGISKVTFLFIDDGSEDDSVQILKDHFKSGENAKIVRLSRNFGHQAAISAGLSLSQADLTAIIDADLQDPPEYILEMIKKWREGYEIVWGRRTNRKENRVKVFFYWLFYRLYKYLTPIEIPLDSGDFCLMSQRVVQEISKLPEKLRFLRGLRAWVGFPQAEITYDRPLRAAGNSKYNFGKLYELATDGLASMSVRPLQLAQFLALLYLLFSFIVFFVTLISVFSQESYDLKFLILLTLILFSNSIILLCIYILGAYIGRAYLESKGRPNHIVQEIIDFEGEG